MRQLAPPEFWKAYRSLPEDVRELAKRCFATLEADTSHPSLQLKRVDRYWLVRVGLHYRAVGIDAPEGIVWFWIGRHGQYDSIVRR